jgi:hypothetical protein
LDFSNLTIWSSFIFQIVGINLFLTFIPIFYSIRTTYLHSQIRVEDKLQVEQIYINENDLDVYKYEFIIDNKTRDDILVTYMVNPTIYNEKNEYTKYESILSPYNDSNRALKILEPGKNIISNSISLDGYCQTGDIDTNAGNSDVVIEIIIMRESVPNYYKYIESTLSNEWVNSYNKSIVNCN